MGTRQELEVAAVMAEGLHLREAGPADAEVLLNWRSDPLTRANSFNTGEVSTEEHAEWLESALKDPAISIYIAELDGVPVGTVRIERKNDVSELSWTVAPEARGRGVGKRVVAEAVRITGGAITAKIKAGNEPSKKIARAVGFTLVKEDERATYWRRG